MGFLQGGLWRYAMEGPTCEERQLYQCSSAQHEGVTRLDAFSDANAVENKHMPQSKWDVTFAEAILDLLRRPCSARSRHSNWLRGGHDHGGLDELLAKKKK